MLNATALAELEALAANASAPLPSIFEEAQFLGIVGFTTHLAELNEKDLQRLRPYIKESIALRAAAASPEVETLFLRSALHSLRANAALTLTPPDFPASFAELALCRAAQQMLYHRVEAAAQEHWRSVSGANPDNPANVAQMAE